MRIRKQASKLLGWASSTAPYLSSSPSPSPAAHSWPPPPLLPESSTGEPAAGGLRCQLNLSPWDAMDSHFCTDSQEEEEEAFVAENVFEAKEEQITSAGPAAAAEMDENGVKEIDASGKKEKKPAAKKIEEIAINAAYGHDTTIIAMKCKKTDGKGWHCKRPAELSHSLCRYHLTQLRSYNHREASFDNGSRHGRKKKLLTSVTEISGGSAASNYYYYYSAFGPWRSKRRGPIDAVNEEKESSESPDISCVMADDDDDVDGDDAEDEEEDDVGKMNKSKQERAEGKKKKRPLKRKGRKPVKARSLKSLL